MGATRGWARGILGASLASTLIMTGPAGGATAGSAAARVQVKSGVTADFAATPAQIKDGVTAGSTAAPLLFQDDFQDGDTAGWRPSGGRWAAGSDESGTVLTQSVPRGRAAVRTGPASWADYAVTARVKPLTYRGTGSSAGVQARVQPDGSHYYLVTTAHATVELGKVVNGRSTTLATAEMVTADGFWRSLSLVLKGSALVGVVNGAPLLRATDTRLTRGRAGLATTDATASFDDVLVESYAPTNPDTQAPLSPGRPTVVAVTPTTATITWRPAVDNVGVVDYVVYQGDQFYQQNPVRTVTGTGPVTLPLNPNAASIHFAVSARDAAGNASALVDRVTIAQPPSFPKTGDDTVPPSPAGNPVMSGRTADGRGILTWAPATDNIGVVEYHVILVTNIDEVRLLAKVTEPTATVSVNGTNPLVRVIAYDASWNSSTTPLVPYGPGPTPTPTPTAPAG